MENNMEIKDKRNEIVRNITEFAVTWLAIGCAYYIGAKVTKWKLMAEK